jgi:Holliday junction resolvase RusA-like endonuclease
MNSIKLTILGTPQPKQADRSRIAKGEQRHYVHHYKSTKVLREERNIRAIAQHQLPTGFIPFNEPIGIKALFVFPMLKSFPKYRKKEIERGIQIYRDKKPDLTDNLMKGLCDALEGVIYINDSRICKVESQKIYGTVPRTEITIYKLSAYSKI